MAIKSRHKANPEFSLASMSDLVFLLLIFFMLTSSFIEPAGLKIEYPEGGQSSNKATNNVTINEEGEYAWNQMVIRGETREEKEDQIRERIEKVLTDEDEENNVITLRVDKAVTMEHTATIMTMIAEFNGTVVIADAKRATMNASEDQAYKRKKRGWIIAGVIVFVILVCMGVGSMAVGLIYNSLRPTPPPPKTSVKPPPGRQEITLKADGTYLWNGERVPGNNESEKLEALKAKIFEVQANDLWKIERFCHQWRARHRIRPDP